VIQVQLDNGWLVKPFDEGDIYGLDVFENGELICEMVDVSFNDYLDEWRNIDEDELEAAIREEIETDELCKKLGAGI
jgi:hypothetical protein